MNRKTIREQNQDEIDTVLNAQDFGDMIVKLEEKAYKIHKRIKKEKSKKVAKELRKKLYNIETIIFNMSSNNISFLNH